MVDTSVEWMATCGVANIFAISLLAAMIHFFLGKLPVGDAINNSKSDAANTA